MIKFLLNTILVVTAIILIVVIMNGSFDTIYSLLAIMTFIWIFGLVNPKSNKKGNKWSANSFGKWSGGGRNKNRNWK